MSEPLLLRRGLSLDRLESFCRVAETGSIVRAAGGDPVRQSLYSRQIRELGEFFGVELLRRDGRGIQLTTAGRRLAELAREQFAALRDFRDQEQHRVTTLTLAAGNSVLEWVITPLLPKLCEQIPGTQIALLNRRSRDIVRDLQDLKVDVGIVRDDALTAGLKHAPFLEIAYALLVPRKLARGLTDQQVLKHLDRFPLALTAGESFEPRFRQAAHRAGLACEVAVSCSSFTQAAELLASGAFGAVLPQVAQARLDNRSCRLIEAPFLASCSRRLCLAWHPRLAAVRPVVEKATAALQRLARP